MSLAYNAAAIGHGSRVRTAIMPTVSVILPAYNRRPFLESAIASVFAQTAHDWELIVADDGSAPEVLQYLQTLDAQCVRVIALEHSGNPGKVRNAAMAAATGRYLAFLDSDDLWEPQKLARQLEALRDGHARWSYCICRRIDEQGAPLPAAPAAARSLSGSIYPPLLRLDIAIAMPAVVVERGLAMQLGFDEALRYGEFHDFCLRLALASPAAAVDQALCAVRAHREHFSADRAAAFASWIRLYEKHAQLAPDAESRAWCLRLQAVTAARLAAAHASGGARRAAFDAWRDALPYAWRYPAWWWSSARTLARAALPA